jgi:acetyltransferase-like isoleucine patch superfamily enzyme
VAVAGSGRHFLLTSAAVIAADFFAWPPSLARFAPFFAPEAAPWEWLRQIGPALAAAGLEPWSAPAAPGLRIEGAVWIDSTVTLPHIGTILGPAWIGPGCELRPGVLIRGNVIAGAGCVLGNACEFKNCLLLDGVEVPHFSYVGDSILGNRAHLGAGVVLSNLRLDRQNVVVRPPEGPAIDTGLRKFGAIFGDGAEAGCNAVLNPGTLLGPRALVAPATAVGGFVPAAHIARVRGRVEFIPRRD